jgi:hypothetical protein
MSFKHLFRGMDDTIKPFTQTRRVIEQLRHRQQKRVRSNSTVLSFVVGAHNIDRVYQISPTTRSRGTIGQIVIELSVKLLKEQAERDFDGPVVIAQLKHIHGPLTPFTAADITRLQPELQPL